MRIPPLLPLLALLGISLLGPVPALGQAGELRELERLAEESFAQDDLATAVALYRQLAERFDESTAEGLAESVRVRITVAWLEHLRGRRATALGALTDVLVLDPDHRFRPELYDSAFTRLFYDAKARAEQQRQADASRFAREGSERLRAGDTEGARTLYHKALAAWPDETSALYNLALADYYDGRTDDALDGFQKLLALADARPDEGVVSASLRALALTNVGSIYLERGQDTEAVEALEEAAAIDPENASAWSNLGIARRRLGRADAAVEALERAWSLDRDDPSTARNLALAQLDADRASAAADLLREATTRFPEDGGLWLYLGRARRTLGDATGAAVAFEQAQSRDPENADGWAASAALELAAHHFAAGDARRTVEQAKRAVRWREDAVNGWAYLGLAQQRLGDLDAARESLEQALRLDPARADVHNSLGSVHFESGRLDEAEASFERALSIDPGLEGARRNLDAVAAVRRGERTLPKSDSRPSAGIERPAPPPPRSTETGLRFADIDYAELGLSGVMVERVIPNTPADRAGVRADDLILKMDGRTVTSGGALRDYVAGRRPGSVVELQVLRENRPVTLRLEVP